MHRNAGFNREDPQADSNGICSASRSGSEPDVAAVDELEAPAICGAPTGFRPAGAANGDRSPAGRAVASEDAGVGSGGLGSSSLADAEGSGGAAGFDRSNRKASA